MQMLNPHTAPHQRIMSCANAPHTPDGAGRSVPSGVQSSHLSQMPAWWALTLLPTGSTACATAATPTGFGGKPPRDATSPWGVYPPPANHTLIKGSPPTKRDRRPPKAASALRGGAQSHKCCYSHHRAGQLTRPTLCLACIRVKPTTTGLACP